MRRLQVIRWLLIAQLLSALLLGVLAWTIWGAVTGTSALLGGLICWLPNCYFAFRAFRYRGARQARRIVRSFYAGAAGKMALTFGLFALVFAKVEPISPLALFGGFVGVQMLNWIVPLVAAQLDRSANAW